MSKTYRYRSTRPWSRAGSDVPNLDGRRRGASRAEAERPRFAALGDTFRCRHCRMMVGPVLWGGRHRNHCPLCLYSRHVDDRTPGDRASTCGSSMAPVGVFTRPSGESVIVHRCLGCGLERHCRVAADDDFALVMALPLVEPRGSGVRTERALDETA